MEIENFDKHVLGGFVIKKNIEIKNQNKKFLPLRNSQKDGEAF